MKMTIKSCEFNMDTACIEVQYENGSSLSMYLPHIEEELRTTPYSFSKLQLMLDSEPLRYAEKILDGTMQEYLDWVDGVGKNRLKNYTEQLSKKYSKNIAEDIAREILMYE